MDGIFPARLVEMAHVEDLLAALALGARLVTVIDPAAPAWLGGHAVAPLGLARLDSATIRSISTGTIGSTPTPQPPPAFAR
jgi:hypothetical protein